MDVIKSTMSKHPTPQLCEIKMKRFSFFTFGVQFDNIIFGESRQMGVNENRFFVPATFVCINTTENCTHHTLLLRWCWMSTKARVLSAHTVAIQNSHTHTNNMVSKICRVLHLHTLSYVCVADLLMFLYATKFVFNLCCAGSDSKFFSKSCLFFC